MSKKKVFTPKFFISLMTLIMSIVACITATYAWFKFPTKNWISDISIEVTQGKAVELSIDGSNFSNSLSALDAKKAIVQNYKGYYYEIQNDGTSILKDKDGNFVDDSLFDYEDLFKDFTLSPVTTLDGTNFYTRDNLVVDRTRKGAYINLPLYAKLNAKIVEGDVTDYRPLYLNNATQFLGSGSDIKTIYPTQINSDSISVSPLNDFYEYDENGNSLKVTSNDTVEVNPRDAMRIAFTSDDNSSIFEPYLGLGSYAVDYTNYVPSEHNLGSSSIDSTKNAAFTHYNNIVSKNIDPLSFDSYQKIQSKLYHNFNNVDSLNIATINGVTPTKFYITVWLEGYDADCLDYLNSKSISINLSFTTDGIKEEKNNVVYNFRDGSEVQTINKIELSDTLTPSNLDILYIPFQYRERNEFLYWSLDRLNPITDLEFDNDVIVYAVWGLEMKFNLDGGVFTSDYKEFITGTVVEPENPTRNGYTFNGWFLDEGLTKPFTPITLYEGIDLYASWSQN